MREHLKQSNQIEGIYSAEQDAQAIKAWTYLIDQRKIDADVIKRTHKIVTYSQPGMLDNQKGVWREVKVRIGSHVPPPPNQIKKKMTEWIKSFQQYPPP